MRLMLLAFFIVFSSGAIALMPAGMQEAMDCMQSLDQEALEEMGSQGEKVANDIKALCKKGDDLAAMEMAMTYVKDMADSEVLEALKHCSELMRKAMPNMPLPEIPSAEMYAEEAGNICDDIE